MEFVLNILNKHRTALICNLKNIPGIEVDLEKLPIYKKQLREVNEAINLLQNIDINRARLFDDLRM